MAKIHLYKSDNDTVLIDPPRQTVKTKNGPGRRLEDMIGASNRKLNLERRVACNERRINKAAPLNIPSRRNIIDRRRNRTDRRNKNVIKQH